jgi:hypothetical protein
MGGDLDPFAAAGDHRQHRGPAGHDPHIVLQLRHILLGRAFLENDQGSMNLASNTAPVASTRPSRVAPIQRTIGCRTRGDTPHSDIGSALLRLMGKDETQCASAGATVYRSGDRKLLGENCGGRSAAKAPGKRL